MQTTTNDFKILVLAMREGFELHIDFSDRVDTDRKALATRTDWDGCCCPGPNSHC